MSAKSVIYQVNAGVRTALTWSAVVIVLAVKYPAISISKECPSLEGLLQRQGYPALSPPGVVITQGWEAVGAEDAIRQTVGEHTTEMNGSKESGSDPTAERPDICVVSKQVMCNHNCIIGQSEVYLESANWNLNVL